MHQPCIGVRQEDKYLMERRVSLTPAHVKRLVETDQLCVVVQSSDKRIFKDEEYRQAGAVVSHQLHASSVVFGVKEIPEQAFEPGKTYVFFSHVIKGQPYNMPMLRKMMDLGCNLIDYECITDDQNKRIIFFGKYAGLAGMINSLWSLGQRLKELGDQNNPFLPIRQAHHYDSLEQAKHDISMAGRYIAENGLPDELLPLTIGFTGYGNVSVGAQEIASLLPSIEVTPDQLADLAKRKSHPRNVIYKTIFKEQHLVRSKAINGSCGCGCGCDEEVANAAHAPAEFDLQHYYQHPDLYESCFEKYLPHLTVLMNCMYWDARYPRIVTKESVKKLFSSDTPKMTVIGDITCDPEGSVEITHKGTEIEDPVFVYNPETGEPRMGFKGHGLLVMAVDILPSELPRDSSIAFADALAPFVKDIAMANYSVSYSDIQLPAAIKKAMILHQGKLTPPYEYIYGYL